MKKYIELIKRNNIAKSSMGLVIIALLGKVLGYGEKITLAYYYGTGFQVDVYTTVVTIILSFFFFFREIIEPGFLNVFLSAKNNNDEKGAWGLFNLGVILILLLTTVISILAIVFPGTVIGIFAPGFKGEKWSLSVELIKIAISACIFLSISTLTNITLNGLKIFLLPAFGELAFKATILICLFFFIPVIGIKAVAYGILAGAIIKLFIHFIKLYNKVNFTILPNQKSYQTSVWVLTWPLLLGVSFSQICNIADNMFASYLQEGAIASLSYSKKIIELPVILFPYILSVVVFPYFTQLVIEKNYEKLTLLFTRSLRWIVIVFLPVSIFFFVFSQPIIEVILQRGAFNKDSTLLTSAPLAIYALGLVFFAIETILVIFYYANSDTKTPVFIGIVCSFLHIILSYILLQFMGYLGIALAYVIQKIVKNLVLLLLIKNKIIIDMSAASNFFIKTVLATCAFILVIILMKTYIYDSAHLSFLMRVMLIAISFIIALVPYIYCIYVMGILKQVKNVGSQK